MPGRGQTFNSEKYRAEREIIFENVRFMIEAGETIENIARRSGRSVVALRGMAYRYDKELHQILLRM